MSNPDMKFWREMIGSTMHPLWLIKLNTTMWLTSLYLSWANAIKSNNNVLRFVNIESGRVHQSRLALFVDVSAGRN